MQKCDSRACAVDLQQAAAPPVQSPCCRIDQASGLTWPKRSHVLFQGVAVIIILQIVESIDQWMKWLSVCIRDPEFTGHLVVILVLDRFEHEFEERFMFPCEALEPSLEIGHPIIVG